MNDWEQLPPLQRRGRPKNEGYMLVEVLATMTISAFILAALFSVASFTLRASAAVDRGSQGAENIGRVAAALSREIRTIAPLRWAGPQQGFVFQGSADRLLFARIGKAPDGIVEAQAVILQARANQLWRSEAPLLPTYRAAAELIASPTQDIMDGRFQVHFAYFSTLPGGQEALTDGWDDPARMPIAVRVSLADDRGLPLASVRVEIEVSAEPGCAAPGRATCSLVATAPDDAGEKAEAHPAVDADDASGWERYAK